MGGCKLITHYAEMPLRLRKVFFDANLCVVHTMHTCPTRYRTNGEAELNNPSYIKAMSTYQPQQVRHTNPLPPTSSPNLSYTVLLQEFTHRHLHTLKYIMLMSCSTQDIFHRVIFTYCVSPAVHTHPPIYDDIHIIRITHTSRMHELNEFTTKYQK